MIIRGQAIIDFLEGKTEDYKGRTFLSTLQWSDAELEQCHDQIQQIFPLHEESKHAHTYPIVDKNVIDRAIKSEVIKENLILAKNRFERFYGIGEYFDKDVQRKWCKNYNHNLLRITRIIRCLRLFGLEEEAKDFWNRAVDAGKYFGISATTITYWDKAMNDDVWGNLQ